MLFLFTLVEESIRMLRLPCRFLSVPMIGSLVIAVIVWGRIFVGAAEVGDGTDDLQFMNSLTADLAPLLSLFGEQPTKQFMSQSMGWADSIIFAMAPIGIITAVTSAIRVAGHPYLKRLIGRARESSELVEQELLSSTSQEVYEVCEGRSVIRQIGTGFIKVLLIDSSLGTEEIYDLAGAVKAGLLKRPDKIKAEIDIDQLPPNLVFNVGGPVLSKSKAWLFAIFAIMLQAAVLVVDGLITFYWDRLSVPDAAHFGFPVTCTGIICLCLGMLACSYVVEGSTKEVKYTFKDEDSSQRLQVVWLQKGGQVGHGPQGLSACAIFRPNSDKKAAQSNLLSPNQLRPLATGTVKPVPIWVSFKCEKKYLEWWAFSGTCLSVAGLVMEFEGLRRMHYAASFAQLVATLLMLSLRAWARASLSKIPIVEPIPDGYELDWLAMKLARLNSWAVCREPFSLPEHGAQLNCLDPGILHSALLHTRLIGVPRL